MANTLLLTAGWMSDIIGSNFQHMKLKWQKIYKWVETATYDFTAYEENIHKLKWHLR